MRAYSYTVSGSGNIPIFASTEALRVLDILGVRNNLKTLNCRLIITVEKNVGNGAVLFSTQNLVYDGKDISTVILDEPLLLNMSYDSMGRGNFLLDETTQIKGGEISATVTLYIE